jgi:hypothetical protein
VRRSKSSGRMKSILKLAREVQGKKTKAACAGYWQEETEDKSQEGESCLQWREEGRYLQVQLTRGLMLLRVWSQSDTASSEKRHNHIVKDSLYPN